MTLSATLPSNSREAPRPCVDVRVRVVRAPEAEIAEGRGRDRRRAQVLAVRDAERRPVRGEERVRRVREPALVPELEGRLEAWRETPVTTLVLGTTQPEALRTLAELVL